MYVSAVFASAAYAPAAYANDGGVKAVWAAGANQPSREIKTWTLKELGKLSSVSRQEKDPATQQLSWWKGVNFGQWIDKSLEELPLEQRAKVDLIILKGAGGKQSIIPRYVTRSYALLLAAERNHKSLAGLEAPLQLVVPLSSSPKILKEGLPLEAYSIAGVTEVVLTSYEARGLSLQRRTDPAAVRGEKLFVTNCVSCHASGRAPALTELSGLSGVAASTRSLASSGHPEVSGSPRLGEREVRALNSYLEAVRGQTRALASPTAVVRQN